MDLPEHDYLNIMHNEHIAVGYATIEEFINDCVSDDDWVIIPGQATADERHRCITNDEIWVMYWQLNDKSHQKVASTYDRLISGVQRMIMVDSKVDQVIREMGYILDAVDGLTNYPGFNISNDQIAQSLRIIFPMFGEQQLEDALNYYIDNPLKHPSELKTKICNILQGEY